MKNFIFVSAFMFMNHFTFSQGVLTDVYNAYKELNKSSENTQENKQSVQDQLEEIRSKELQQQQDADEAAEERKRQREAKEVNPEKTIYLRNRIKD